MVQCVADAPRNRGVAVYLTQWKGRIMAETITLTLSPREVTGKKVKRLRRGGLVPVHLYGGTTTPSALQVEAGTLRRILDRVGGNVPLTVEVEGTEEDNICFVREVQRHPVSEDLLHVDFLRVEATQTVIVDVPIILDGDAPAVRNLGGTLAQPLQTLTVEALPLDVPAELHADVTGLEDFETAVRVGDIPVGEGIQVLNDAADMVARVMQPRLEEEFEVVTEEEELEEGEVAEGEEGEAVEGEETPEAEEGESDAGEPAAGARRR